MSSSTSQQESLHEIVHNFDTDAFIAFSKKTNNEDFKQEILKKNEETQQTVLHVACQLGYSKLVIQILEKLDKLSALDSLEWTDSTGSTALMLAIQSSEDGIPEIIESLLKKGANPLSSNAEGNTPLHIAASLGQEETSRILITQNVKTLSKRNNLGQTPLISSIIEGQFNIINLMLQFPIELKQYDNAGRSVMHYAATTKGNSPAYLRLLVSKCDINDIDNEGNTPIIYAARTSVKKNYRAIEALIGMNAELTIKNRSMKSLANYIEEIHPETQSTADYYQILKAALQAKGVTLKETEQSITSESSGGCCSKEESSSDCCSKGDSEKSGCCSDSSKSGCGDSSKKVCCGKKKCGSKKADSNKGGCCSDNSNLDSSTKSCGGDCKCESQPKKVTSTPKVKKTEKPKQKFDTQEKAIIAALVPLNILLFYLIFQFVTQQ